MNRFAALCAALDGTTDAGEKTATLAAYFRAAPEPDRLWTVALLSGRRPKRAVTITELRQWAAQAAGLPDWLMEASCAVTGDIAETTALVLPETATTTDGTLSDRIGLVTAVAGQPPEARKAAVVSAWVELGSSGRFLFNKLLTGGFRLGVSRGLMTRALAIATGRAEPDIAHRLIGDWTPATTTWAALTEGSGSDAADPYPFALASALVDGPGPLGDPADWRAEWKWDGIRGQIILRDGAFALWSQGGELVTDRFPEFAPLADALPVGTVIEVEILTWRDGAPRPCAALQTRIDRKTVTKRMLAEAPAHLLACDLLEHDGHDLRGQPFDIRRALLDDLLARLPPGLPLSALPLIPFADWPALAAARARSRAHRAEGIMLTRGLGAYVAGPGRGDCRMWKAAPLRVVAVMVYAQAGHGRDTDFTFAVRDGEALVPFAKAHSGLTDAEFAEIATWVKAHTVERFGPVRRVAPELVFELAFDAIRPSPRHKSGVILQVPCIARWHRDQPSLGIDTLDSLRALLP